MIVVEGMVMPRAVTIRDVARRAGVSRQTVSRAINNKGEISPETRMRILRIAHELGYHPESVARGLKANRVLTIGLVVSDIANPFFAEVARGASAVANESEYNVLLCNTDESPEREWAALRTLQEHRVDGLVLVGSRLSSGKLDEAIGVWRPIVVVSRSLARQPGLACVLVNDAKAAMVAVQHLVGRGHKRIGFLGGSAKSRSSRERRRGYLQAMRGAGLDPKERWTVDCAPNVAGGRRAAHRLLDSERDLTALLAYNDLVAVGAEQACKALGRPVPDGCALVGWDDIFLASCVSPPLTTVHMPKYEIGQRAVSSLFELMRDPDLAPKAVVLDARLVVRGSS